MSILDLHSDVTSAALPRYVKPPQLTPTPTFSSWKLATSPLRGAGEAVAQVGASIAEVVAGYGDVMGRIESGQSLQDRQPDMQSDFGDALRDRGREFRPDPLTAHTAEQVLYGFARGATKVVGGTLAMGPGGAIVAGAEEAVSAADDLAREGVDFETRVKAGAVQGAGLALAALPLVGQTLPQTAALYLAGGPGGFVAQQALTREILRAGGYEGIAEQYDPLDPVGLAVSALIPAAFTAAGIRGQRAARRVAVEVEDAARVALQAEQRASTNPEIGPRAADQHEAALTRAEDAMARGDEVHVADVVPPRPAAVESLDAFVARTRVQPEPMPPAPRSDFVRVLQDLGGIDYAAKLDITGEPGVRSNPGGVFRKGGLTTDVLADAMIERGFLRPGDGSPEFVELVQAHIRGEPVLNFEQQQIAAVRSEAEANQSARLAAVEERLRLLGVDTTPAKGNLAVLEAYAKQHEPAMLRAALDEARAVDEFRPEFEELRDRARALAQDVQDGGRTLEQFEAEVQPLSPVMRRLVAEALSAPIVAAMPERALDMGRLTPAFDAAKAGDTTDPAAANIAVGLKETAGDPRRAKALADELAARGKTDQDPVDATADAVEKVRGLTDEQLAEIESASLPSRIDTVRAQFPDLMVRMDGDEKALPLDEFLARVKAEADEMEADAPLMQVAAECALLLGN